MPGDSEFLWGSGFLPASAGGWTITVGGVDISTAVDMNTIRAISRTNQQVGEMDFTIIDPTNTASAVSKQEIVLSDAAGTRWWGGIVAQVTRRSDTKVRIWDVVGQDYSALLDSRVVNEIYAGTTDVAILANLLSKYRPDFTLVAGSGVSTRVDRIAFPLVTLRKAINDLSKYTGLAYYVDASKVLHYVTPSTAPVATLTTASPDGVTTYGYEAWQFKEDGTQIRNRITVVGATYESSPITDSFVGSSVQTVFPLTQKVNTLSGVTLAGATVATGFVGKDQFDGTILALIDAQQQTIAFQNAPPAGQSIQVTYTYLAPAMVRTSRAASTTYYGDTYDAIISDSSLPSVQAVTDRAASNLDRYAFPQYEAKLITRAPGIVAGQIVQVVNTPDGVTIPMLATEAEWNFMGRGVIINRLTLTA